MKKQRLSAVLVTLLIIFAALSIGAVYGRLSGQNILELTKCGVAPNNTKVITWNFTDALASQTYNYSMTDGAFYRIYTRPISLTAGNTDELAIAYMQSAATVIKVGFIADTAITGDDTNYAALNFYKGVGTSTLIGGRAFTVASGGAAKHVAYTSFGTLTNTTLATGDVLHVDKIEAAAGQTVDGLVFVVVKLR